MRTLLLALLMACSGSALAQGAAAMMAPSPVAAVVLLFRSYIKEQTKAYYIQVESQAENFEKAKQQAFRLASEQVAGTVVLSESELRNSRLTRDEIITYSSGLVDEYRIVSRVDAHNHVQLVVDIWIQESVMAQRLLARSASEQGIRGADLATRVESIQQERQRGDAVFAAVIRDFPRRAFAVRMSRPNIVMDPYRNVMMFLDVEIRWDQRYLAAVYEAAQRTGRRPCMWRCAPGAKFYIQGWEFDDIQKLVLIHDVLGSSDLHLLLEIASTQASSAYKKCFAFGSLASKKMYGFGGNQLNLWDQPYQARVSTNLGTNTVMMSTLDNVRIEVVTGSQCR